MLGIKSIREPIKGTFAEKLREQILLSKKASQTDVAQVRANKLEESRK